MDIHQLRSWIFELYEPLEDQRQYIVFDRERGNLLVDAPVFGERPLRLIRGVGGATVLLITSAARGADAARYRDALGLQVAAHAADASSVPGGADVVVNDGDLLRADARVHRVGANGDGATVVLLRKAGGVLFCGDLDLASDAARDLTKLSFSSVLSSGRAPIWDAGRDSVLLLQRELPAPKKRFGIFLQAPWDRAYRGRLQDQMTASPLVPQEETTPREAGMGPSTLIAADTVRDKVERAKRPVPATPRVAAAAVTGTAPSAKAGRPRNFAEDWQAPATASPPTTRANAPRDIQPPSEPVTGGTGAFRPVPFGAEVPKLAVEAIAGLPGVEHRWGGIDLATDGSEVAFAWDRSGGFEIYSTPITGDRIFQLTDAGARSVWPRWSPDGRTIAFLRDSDGSEQFGIWTVDREGEHERELVPAAGGTRRDLCWSADGRTIACVSGHGGAFGIDLVDADSGAVRRLTDGTTDARPRYSPDGRWIVFDGNRSERREDVDLFLVPFAGGAPVALDTRGGLAGESFDARFSPDGQQIAFTTNVRGRREIAVATLDGTVVRTLEFLTENPFEEWGSRWRPDQRGVIYLHEQDAAVAVHRAFTVSHAATPVSDLPGLNDWPQVGPDSEIIVSTFSSARRPTDIWVRDPHGVEIRALTDSLSSASAPVDPAVFVEPRHVRYDSGGRQIPALLYLPHAEVALGDPPAAVLYIHGGPADRHDRGWDPVPQVLANHGFVVLAPNVRGSTGYGREFQEANRSDWGGADLADVIAGAGWLTTEGIADAAHLGICGASYGGYLTLLALGRHPGVFAAGASAAGIVSLETLYRTTRGDGRAYLDREIGPLTGNEPRYRAASPITYAAQITAPLLILHGAHDPIVPKSEAEQLVAALHRSGTPHEYHEYPDEGHRPTKTVDRIDELRRVTEWFERHLTPLMLRHL